MSRERRLRAAGDTYWFGVYQGAAWLEIAPQQFPYAGYDVGRRTRPLLAAGATGLSRFGGSASYSARHRQLHRFVARFFKDFQK